MSCESPATTHHPLRSYRTSVKDALSALSSGGEAGAAFATSRRSVAGELAVDDELLVGSVQLLLRSLRLEVSEQAASSAEEGDGRGRVLRATLSASTPLREVWANLATLETAVRATEDGAEKRKASAKVDAV